MAKTTRPKPHVTLDMKGAACPGPLLGARRVLDELLAGEVLLLISDCPATKDDLASWPKYADVEILKAEKRPRGGTAYYFRECQTPMRVISEYALDALDCRPKLLVFPSPRAFRQQAWKKLLDWVNEGATLLVTGTLDADEHWLPVSRATELGLETSTRPVAPEEFLAIEGNEYQLSYREEKVQRLPTN